MALAPLQIQKPTVSLIGGKELPKASGEGVRAPDISNAFSDLSNTLQRKAEQGAILDDQAQAKVDAEFWRDKTVGKSPLDRYVNPPVVNGSPAYRAAVTAGLEQNAISDVRSIYNAQAGAIQMEVGPTTPEKIARMVAAADGVINTIAPEYRQQAREYVQADIAAREQTLRGEDSRQLEHAIEEGQNRRLREAFDKGVSAASAGADWTEYTKEIRGVLDEKVAQGKILPEDAEAEKKRLTNLVVAEGIHRTISSEAMKGNISAADVIEMGVAMEAGAPFEIYADRLYEPGFEGDRYDTGQTKRDPAKRKIISADEYKALIADPSATKAIAENIQQLGHHLASFQKGHEKELQLLDWMEKNRTVSSNVVPAALQSTYNEMIDLAIRRRALDTPEGRDAIKAMTLVTNYMSPELIKQLTAKTQGTYQEALLALNFYNELTSGVRGTIESGKIIQQSINAADASLFQSATDFAADVLRKNAGNEKAAAEEWRRAMNKLADPANTEQFYAEDYYDRTKRIGSAETLEAAIRRMSLDHYGRTTLDANIMREAKLAYRNSMILTAGLDQEAVLEQVMERIYNRYTASPIFKSGIAPVEAWENPDIDGYRKPTILGIQTGPGPDPNQWTNDYVTGQLQNFLDSGQINAAGMTVEGINALNAALAAGGDMPLGTNIFLEPVNGDRAHTQFKVLVSVEQGASTETVMINGPDGRPTELLLDPGLLLSNINNRNRAIEAYEETSQAYKDTRQRDIIKQYGQSRPEAQPALRQLLDDPAVFDKWFREQDEGFQDAFKAIETSSEEVLKKQLQRYNDLEKTLVPEGMVVDPKLLGTPKAAGKGIVLGAVDAVGNLFGDDQNTRQFMVNLIGGETRFGMADQTFRASGDRGLAQVNDSASGGFMEVKRRAAMPGDPLYAMAQRAKAVLGIDVASLVPSDLDKPVVNVLVSRMYVSRNQEPIPSDPQLQAAYWREHYNPGATDKMIDNWLKTANTLMVGEAYAATGAGGPGMVTDMAGNAFPAHFTSMNQSVQLSVQRLSGAFGKPLRITPHGGKSARPDKPGSQHPRGTAVDIFIDDYTDAEKTQLVAIAIKMGFRGIGSYPPSLPSHKTIHLDMRNTGKHGGLALWYGDGNWTRGPKWYTDGVKQGSAWKGLNLG